MQASRLQNYPLSMVSNVVDRTFFPIFSRINGDGMFLKEQIYRLRRQLYAILFPLFSALICFSKPIIIVILGDKWVASSSYFQILMLSSFPLLVKALNRNVLKSLGYTYAIFRIELFSAIFLMLCLVFAFCIRSIYFVVIVVVLCQFFSAFLSVYYLSKIYLLNIKEQIIDIFVFAPCSIIPSVLQYCLSGNLLIRIFVYMLTLFMLVLFYYYRGYREYLFLSILFKK